MIVLDVRALSKSFTIHHLGEHLATFQEVSFTLDAGRFLLLRGPNGAGKSTLLRTLYRTYRADGGQILFHGRDGTTDLARAADIDIVHLRRHEIGFVTQFLTARPRVSAEALVAEPLILSGETTHNALARARDALDMFGLRPNLFAAYPSTFSGGEQQKVNLARALILPKRLMLLDEPTASLDANARTALVDRLQHLKDQGVALIGVFHHPGDVAELIDHDLQLQASVDPSADQLARLDQPGTAMFPLQS